MNEPAIISNELEKSVIEEITSLHHDIKSMIETTLQKGIRLGELLKAVKDGLPHGEFIPWIEKNCPFKQRAAQNYMRVFERREELKRQSVADLASAYKLLTSNTHAHAYLDDDIQLVEIDEDKELTELYARIDKLTSALEDMAEQSLKKDDRITRLERDLEEQTKGKKERNLLFESIRKVGDTTLKRKNLEGDFDEVIVTHKIVKSSMKFFRDTTIQLQTVSINDMSKEVLAGDVENLLKVVNAWGLAVAKKFKINMERIK